MSSEAAGTMLAAVAVPALAFGVLALLATAVAVVAIWTLRRQREVIFGLREDLSRVGRTAAIEQTAADDARGRLEHALDTIPQAVLITDADGGVVFRNRAAETFESARHSDALVEAAISELVQAALAGQMGQRTIDLFGPPRRTLVIETSPLISKIDTESDGDADAVLAPRGALAIVDDISERRRLEATRRDFVANISHELRTPIGAVGLLAETLLAEDDPVVAGRLAERIVAEAFRLARTIEDLLVLSTIESGEAPDRERVPVHLVLAEAVERIRPAAEQAGIELQVTEPDKRLGIFGERRQITSALYNLLDNAVKYSDPDTIVEVSARTDGVDVVIRVKDHGIGIPKADLERVFERFYRVDQARSRTTGGTGLGLAIVRHVATNHEGDVRVDSRLGEGSTFELALPSASGPVAVTDDPVDIDLAGIDGVTPIRPGVDPRAAVLREEGSA